MISAIACVYFLSSANACNSMVPKHHHGGQKICANVHPGVGMRFHKKVQEDGEHLGCIAWQQTLSATKENE